LFLWAITDGPEAIHLLIDMMVASTTVLANSRVDDSPVAFLVQSPVHVQEQPHKSSLPPCVIPDIYGQVHPMETDELISSSLRKFDLAVNLLRNDVVAVAERKCPHLLTPSFKLLFLRCEVFHVDVSAWSMGQELLCHAAFVSRQAVRVGDKQNSELHSATQTTGNNG
jgi:hypothetical protein